ncbi:MAG TPA: metallophosphoesterase family protein [Polyangia bacterium]|nr:metallophosphoesterase family protein [Polyangia bacterium]
MGLAAPVAHAAPTIHYGPIISRGATPDKMVVHWGTASNTDSATVTYRVKGTQTSLTATATHSCTNSSSNCDYEATLPSLTEATEYEYAIAGNAVDGTLHFGTCPAAGSPLDVVFYGDSRSGGSVHQMVAGNILAAGADMVFESGDIEVNGNYPDYWATNDASSGQPGFFVGAKNLISVIPFMAVPGNHEHGLIGTTDPTKNYALLFPNPAHPLGASGWVGYYSIVCGGVMFIGLDGNAGTDATQKTWLTSQLSTAKGDATIAHVFVWFHQSPYSIGANHGDDTTTQTWVPLFEDAGNKVRAVFTGHDHNYQRLQHGGLTYIVAGGAGADLYDLNATDKGGATVVGKSKSYNYVKLHITKDFISGAAFDGTTGNPLTNDVTSAAETFTLYGSPSDMGGGGAGGGGGSGGSGGTGGAGGGGDGSGGTGGTGGGGSGGTGSGGNGDTGGMKGCSIGGASSAGAPLILGLALLGLALRRRRA